MGPGFWNRTRARVTTFTNCQRVPRRHKVLTHEQERLFRKVTSVSIHSFVEWLDTFSYVLRSADVTVQEVFCNWHCKISYTPFLSSCYGTLSCACCNWRQHLQRLSPHGLHWSTVDEGLYIIYTDTTLNMSSLELFKRRNQYTNPLRN